MGLALKKREVGLPVSTDAELIARTRAGDEGAYADLYRRHHKAARAAAWCLTHSSVDTEDVVGEAFTQILSVLRRGLGPEGAFRPYLLTCVRNACVARGRDNRTITTDPVVMERTSGTTDGDGLAFGVGSDTIAQAFFSLPDRWQTVLWQTEVEGRSPSDVARDLDLAPGAVAALSYRARKALAQAYLETHVEATPVAACRLTMTQLPGYVRQNARQKDRRAVEAHLADCESCRKAEADLRELNRGLRGLLMPAIAGIPLAAYLAARGGTNLARKLSVASLFSAPMAAGIAVVATMPLLLSAATPSSVHPTTELTAAVADPGPGGPRSTDSGNQPAVDGVGDPNVSVLPGLPVVGSVSDQVGSLVGPILSTSQPLLDQVFGGLTQLRQILAGATLHLAPGGPVAPRVSVGGPVPVDVAVTVPTVPILAVTVPGMALPGPGVQVSTSPIAVSVPVSAPVATSPISVEITVPPLP